MKLKLLSTASVPIIAIVSGVFSVVLTLFVLHTQKHWWFCSYFWRKSRFYFIFIFLEGGQKI